MALADFLKGLGDAPPKRVFDYLTRPRTPAAPVGQRNETLAPRGFVSLSQFNPDAYRIQQQRLQAAPAAPTSPTQSRNPYVAPRASGGLTGGVGGAAPIAGASPNNLPVDPATLQLQQEAANLAQYGSAIAPTAPAAPTAPTPQQPQAQAQGQEDTVDMAEFVAPSPAFADTYKSIYDQMGLSDVRSQIEKTGLDLQALQDKKVEEISLVNENPWLTEGARQERVNAINKRYEMKEGNLINRIELFQSTFEQGRQEAQFIAQQTAADQRAERGFQQDVFLKQVDLAEKRAEAERKLKEQGNEILSVADARALGLPYGTTVEEARQKGVIPQETDYASGVVGEYQFYEQQERAAGRQPLSFDEYQTRDANRKLRAASASGGTGNLDKLLTVEEALKLGVPYGTTKGEAIGRFASGSSGEAAKLQGIVQTLPSEIAQLRTIMSTADRGKLAKILAGLDPATNRLIDQVADKVGRLRSGGAINKDEEARFRGQIIRKADILTGDTTSAVSALDGIEEEARQVAQGIRVTAPSPAGSGTSGKTSSGLGYTVIP